MLFTSTAACVRKANFRIREAIINGAEATPLTLAEALGVPSQLGDELQNKFLIQFHVFN